MRLRSGPFPTVAEAHPTRGREVTRPRGIPEHRLQAGLGGRGGPPGSSHLPGDLVPGAPTGSRGTGKIGGHQRHVGNFQGSYQISFPTNLVNLVHPPGGRVPFCPPAPGLDHRVGAWQCSLARRAPGNAEWFQPSRQAGGGTSPVVQWLRLRSADAGGAGSIPGWGTRIPRALRFGQKKKKKKRWSGGLHKATWDGLLIIVITVKTHQSNDLPG